MLLAQVAAGEGVGLAAEGAGEVSGVTPMGPPRLWVWDLPRVGPELSAESGARLGLRYHIAGSGLGSCPGHAAFAPPAACWGEGGKERGESKRVDVPLPAIMRRAGEEVRPIDRITSVLNLGANNIDKIGTGPNRINPR